jgi:23S rRNA A2030 N6-methylase RlmJ
VILAVGNATGTESSGWWKHQYPGMGASHIDPELANAYREIVNAVSSVYSEAASAEATLLNPLASNQELQETERKLQRVRFAQ